MKWYRGLRVRGDREVRDALRLCRRELRAREFGGFAEANDSGNVFGAGAAVAFVMAAVKLRSERRAGADVERADALGAINFVRGDGEQIHAEVIHVERELAGGLHGVAVEVHIRFGGDAADFFDGLNRAEFIVCVHHADENCFGAQRAANFFGIDDARAPDWHVGDVDALLFERLAGVEDRVMLDRRGDDVLAARG